MKIKDAVQALAALAQESRLEIFRLLVQTGPCGLPAGKISESLAIAPATLSFHLKELANAGLVERRRESRSIVYSLQVEGMRELLGYLTEDCCQGRPDLCEPAAECCPPVQPGKKRTTKKRRAKAATK